MAMNDSAVLTSFSYETDAQMLVAELQAAGIDAFIRTDDCGGLRPEIRNERGVEVIVPRDQLEEASVFLRADAPDEKEGEQGAQTLKRKAISRLFAGGVLAGILISAGWQYIRPYFPHDYSMTSTMDRNGDGVIDEEFSYGKEGELLSAKSDENFDGEWDLWFTYENWTLKEIAGDRDFNGEIDERNYFKDGVVVRSDIKPNGSLKFSRQQFYKHGVFYKENVDTDGDGKHDTRYYYGPFEVLIRTEAL
jgi:hypothetical protein